MRFQNFCESSLSLLQIGRTGVIVRICLRDCLAKRVSQDACRRRSRKSRDGRRKSSVLMRRGGERAEK